MRAERYARLPPLAGTADEQGRETLLSGSITRKTLRLGWLGSCRDGRRRDYLTRLPHEVWEIVVLFLGYFLARTLLVFALGLVQSAGSLHALSTVRT